MKHEEIIFSEDESETARLPQQLFVKAVQKCTCERHPTIHKRKQHWIEKFFVGDLEYHWYVQCFHCRLGVQYFLTETDAVDRWNLCMIRTKP